MTQNKENLPALKGAKDYPVLQAGSIGELVADLKESLQGETISSFDLPSATVGAGGLTLWRLAPEGDPVKEIVGVYMGLQSSRTYYKVPYEETGGGEPPDCVSFDLIEGHGNPGGECKGCPFNQFGTAHKGEGKACSESKTLFILRQGDILPTAVRIPPSSLGAWKNAMLMLLNRKVSLRTVEISLTLTEEKSKKKKIEYARVKVEIARQLEPEEVKVFDSLRKEFGPLIAKQEPPKPPAVENGAEGGSTEAA